MSTLKAYARGTNLTGGVLGSSLMYTSRLSIIMVGAKSSKKITCTLLQLAIRRAGCLYINFMRGLVTTYVSPYKYIIALYKYIHVYYY